MSHEDLVADINQLNFIKDRCLHMLQRKSEYGDPSLNNTQKVKTVMTTFENYFISMNASADHLNSYNLGSYFIKLSLTSTQTTHAPVAGHIHTMFETFALVTDELIRRM